MNKKYTFYIVTVLMVVLSQLALVGCSRVPVGYLDVDNAEFVPKVMNIYKVPNPDTPRATNGAPWTSLHIQGVSGTNPINYEFAGVKCTNGSDEAKFKAMVEKGYLNVNGGLVQIQQDGVTMLPNGSYLISIRVYNEGYSKVLDDVLTIVVADEEPIIEE